MGQLNFGRGSPVDVLCLYRTLICVAFQFWSSSTCGRVWVLIAVAVQWTVSYTGNYNLKSVRGTV